MNRVIPIVVLAERTQNMSLSLKLSVKNVCKDFFPLIVIQEAKVVWMKHFLEAVASLAEAVRMEGLFFNNHIWGIVMKWSSDSTFIRSFICTAVRCNSLTSCSRVAVLRC